MRAFSELFAALDRTTSLNDKLAALVAYLRAVGAADGAWAVALLSGRRPKKPVNRRIAQEALVEYLGIQPWVIDASYELVGDLGETCSLLIDTLRPVRATDVAHAPLAEWMETRLPAIAALEDDAAKKRRLIGWWEELSQGEIFLLQKLISGGFRVGVSESLVVKALAAVACVPVTVMTQRLTGKWAPTPEVFRGFLEAEGGARRDVTQPYAFALAYPLDQAPAELGERAAWSAEWKWDGIRAQLVRREGACHVWSRGEDLVTAAFPEIAIAAVAAFPDDTVVDGEILAFENELPLPFAALQKRLGRKKVTAAVQAATPLRFLAYDLLELGGIDYRDEPFARRREALEGLVAGAVAPLGLSPLVLAATWEDLAAAREAARERGVEGLMLKKLDAPYRAGRKRGDWWKWKVEPLVVDAVLIYAQAGSGRRANLFTDYSFAVWRGSDLVPVAKAYSGLDAGEIAELDRWIRAHTKEKFGPVRSVEPHHVFELGFEGIQTSGRHKAGVALRFPRILRWRRDKTPAEADTLQTLEAMLRTP